MTLEPQTDYVKKYRDDMGLNIGEKNPIDHPNPLKRKAPRPDSNGKIPWHNEINETEISLKDGLCVFCGRTSLNLMVIDIDDHSLFDSFKEYHDKTFIVKSGKRGYHIYFRTYENPKSRSLDNAKKQHLDILGQGKIAVLPPSIHPETKKPYEIISDKKIKQLSRIEEQGLHQKLKDLGFGNAEEIKTVRELHAKDLIKTKGDNGGLDLLRVISSWKVKNPELSKPIIKTMAHAYTNEHHDPPCTDEKVESLVNQSFEYAEDKIAEKAQSIPIDAKAEELLRTTTKKEALVKLTEHCLATGQASGEVGLRKIIKKAEKRIQDEDSPEDVEGLENIAASKICDKYRFMCTNDKSRDLSIYKKGKYVPGGEDVIDTELEHDYPLDSTRDFRGEVLAKIKIKSFVDRDDIDSDPNILNLKNCLYDIEKGIEMPHTPDHKSITQWNITFDKKAKCKRFPKFLNDVILEPTERVSTLEMMAELLWKKSTLTKAYFLLGKGSNGKSVLRDVIIRLVGDNNICELEPEDYADTFLPAQLFGKIANIPDEIDDTKVMKSAKWKTAIARKSITAQFKNGQPFSFIPHATSIMPCNSPPAMDDKSDGTYRRIVPIHFDQIFTHHLTTDLEKQGQKKADDSFTDSLLEDEEISGLFNILVIVVRKLMRTKKLTFGTPVADVRKEWEKLTNTVKSWINACLDVDAEAYNLKTNYYANYVQYCNKMDYKILGSVTFYANFQREGAIEVKKRLPHGTHAQHCFQGYWAKGVPKESAIEGQGAMSFQ